MERADSDIGRFMREVALRILGKPTTVKSNELRFGKHGATWVNLVKGTWHDHSSGEHGGVLALIERGIGLKGRDAVQWMRDQGLDVEDRDRREPTHPNGRRDDPPSRIVATYDYVDEAGNFIFQVVRKEPKTFLQRRKARDDDDPAKTRDGWLWSIKDVRQVPYRLPEIIDFVANGSIIYVVEGEKDANTLMDLGVPATTNAAGSGKWPEQLNPHFRGADVVILPDNDDAGRKHAQKVIEGLKSFAKRIRILELPDLPEKGDVSDWLAAGHTTDELYDLVQDAKEPGAAPPRVSKFGRVKWSDLDLPAPESEDIIDGVFTVGDKSLIVGASKSGKSFLAVDVAFCMATGRRFFGKEVLQRCLVIYQAGEGARGMRKRMRAYRKENGLNATDYVPFELLTSKVDLFRPDVDIQNLIDEINWIKSEHPEMQHVAVFIDTYATATAGADENSGRDMTTVFANVDRIIAATGAHVCLVHHFNANGKARGHTSIMANLDQCLEVVKDEETGIRTATLSKQKDEEDGLTFKFKLERVVVGTRERDGKDITSCIVRRLGEETKSEEAAPPKGTLKVKPYIPSKLGKLIFTGLLNALDKHGEEAPAHLGLPPGTRVVDHSHWKDCYAAISADGRGYEANRMALKRNSETMQIDKVIGRSNPYVWLAGTPVTGFARTFKPEHFDAPEPLERNEPARNDAIDGLDDDIRF